MHLTLFGVGSNRTFMELKYKQAADEEAAIMVLIVPLWN